jgi:hypothetical protein
MRYICSLLIPFCLIAIPTRVLAQYQPQSSLNENRSSRLSDSFYTTAQKLVQEQINLIARIEQAIAQPDANQIRAVRGQLTINEVAVERFLKSQYTSPKTLCNTTNSELNESQAKAYCSMYASRQELLKLAPVLDRLLSRRGETALVRELPLVSGEQKSHPVLSIAPIELPNLGKPATPFATLEPIPASTTPPIVGRTGKTFLANYVPPMQPAIAPPQEAQATLSRAKQLLTKAQTAFPQGTQFIDPRETVAVLDRFSYDLDPQERQIYAKFLREPNTGIFRVLPYSAYHRLLNTQNNRLHQSVSTRYPFPSLSKTKEGFTPSIPLQIADQNFQLMPKGVDYSFMVDLGDIPLEKLDALTNIPPTIREFFLNYQPPKQLAVIQEHRRHFQTGKNAEFPVLATAKAQLNHTYLVRNLQFQLPEIINTGKSIPKSDRANINELLKMQSSDTIIAFRPVRQRSDGSYTVLWRVVNQLPDPEIEDLEAYLE